MTWPPCHGSKPKSARTYRKHLSRKPNRHQSQSSNSALASLVHPRKQDLLTLEGDPQPTSQPCRFISSNTLYDSFLPEIPEEECSTNCETLYYPNPWIVFLGIKDIILVSKLFSFCHLMVVSENTIQRSFREVKQFAQDHPAYKHLGWDTSS